METMFRFKLFYCLKNGEYKHTINLDAKAY